MAALGAAESGVLMAFLYPGYGPGLVFVGLLLRRHRRWAFRPAEETVDKGGISVGKIPGFSRSVAYFSAAGVIILHVAGLLSVVVSVQVDNGVPGP